MGQDYVLGLTLDRGAPVGLPTGNGTYRGEAGANNVVHELSPPTDVVRRQMQAQKTSGTKIEMEVRRLLHADGYRFRVNRKILADQQFRGDIVWVGRRLVVFLDGCFWHGCPAHGTTPKSNTEWWKAKIAANQARDRRVDNLLTERGWTVLRFWEHEDPVCVTGSIVKHLS